MYMSFGGLAADGGYNIRVARSKHPDGPYYDAEGHAMINVRGKEGTLFDDRSIEPYGVKLMGNFQFENKSGYVSPGHNSAFYDEKPTNPICFSIPVSRDGARSMKSVFIRC